MSRSPPYHQIPITHYIRVMAEVPRSGRIANLGRGRDAEWETIDDHAELPDVSILRYRAMLEAERGMGKIGCRRKQS